MFRQIAAGLLGIAMQATLGAALGAPVTYGFSTGTQAPSYPNVESLLGTGAHVSGTFVYDSAAPQVTTVSGLSIYGGFTPGTSIVPSFSSLSGSVAGLTFSDVQGITAVANDTYDIGGSSLVDFFTLNADPSASSSSTRNISGFSTGGYTLANVRLFWGETLSSPALIPDFLSSADLPSAPPTFLGRLALDFNPIDAGGVPGTVFFDSLAVAAIPEPETFGLLLAGLGLLGFSARRGSKTHDVAATA